MDLLGPKKDSTQPKTDASASNEILGLLHKSPTEPVKEVKQDASNDLLNILKKPNNKEQSNLTVSNDLSGLLNKPSNNQSSANQLLGLLGKTKVILMILTTKEQRMPYSVHCTQKQEIV